MEDLNIQMIIEGCLVNNQQARALLFRQVYSIAWPLAIQYTVEDEPVDSIVDNTYLYILDNLSFYDSTKLSFRSWVRQVVIDNGLDAGLPLWKAVYNLKAIESYKEADICKRLNITPEEVQQFYQAAIVRGACIPMELVVTGSEQVSVAWQAIAPVVEIRYSNDESAGMPLRARAKQRIVNGGWIGWAVLISLSAMAMVVLAKTGTVKGNKIKVTKPPVTHVAVGIGYNLPCPNH